MEFYIRYLKYTVYLHHFPWIYPSIICEQTTCCELLVLISRSSLPSVNWKQGSEKLQKSLWLPHKISVWCSINCPFSEERPLFTIIGFNGIDDTKTLMKITIFLAGSTGLELKDCHSVWIQKYISCFLHQLIVVWTSCREQVQTPNYFIMMLKVETYLRNTSASTKLASHTTTCKALRQNKPLRL